MSITPDLAVLSDAALCAVLDAVPEARLVGGSVRDLLARLPVADIDLASPLDPENLIVRLRAAGLRAVPTGIAHGTITAVSKGRGFEITTLRRDVETDGRHARVAWTDDWQEDAARRDFTINAMSMDRAGVVFDYFGGQDDLRAGHVRFVGDPVARLHEDYLRALRFFRFHARYGRGAPDAAALAAISGAVPGLVRLSAERVWNEFRRILAVPDPGATIDCMQQTGVLAALMPEGAEPDRLHRLLAAGAPADPILRLAALLPGQGTTGQGVEPAAQFSARLRLSNADRSVLLALRSGQTPPPDADANTWRRLLADEPAEILAGRCWLSGRDPGALARIARPVFPLEGRDAMALGMRPGPEMGRVLRTVRDWWLAGGCLADAAACRAKLAELAPR